MSQVIKTVWATDFEYGGLPEPCSDTSNYRDSTRFPCSVTSGCTTVHGRDWGITSNYHYNGAYADSAQVSAGDTLWFTTCAFSTLGDTFVTVEFNHICKVDLLDGGKVEVSNDSGQTWNTLGQNEYINTKGAQQPLWNSSLGYGYFSENSYAHVIVGGLNRWRSPFDSIPTNSWWEYEYFNASSFLGGVNSSANCMLRFSLADGTFPPGPANSYGWIIDSIRVKSAPCENIKPYGEFAQPIIYHGSLVYSLGPYSIYAKMYDDPVAYTGYQEAWLFYSVNGGAVDSVKYDSIITTSADSIYRAIIPKVYNGVDSFKAGDSVCYWTIVYDRSIPCRNSYYMPNVTSRTCNQFYITNGRQIPYCDDFENASQANFWDTTIANGLVGWERGNPFAGGGYNAYSGTNTWTTVLSGNYAANDTVFLNSPIFDFTTAITPRISFWHRRNMPTSTLDQDRYSLEYSINGNPWQQLGGSFDTLGKLLNAPQCPSTWYDQSNGFSGRFHNNIWREAFYQLPATFTGQNQVQFRFAFRADGNAQRGYGVSMDDWCIQNPPNRDVSVIEVVRPFIDYIKREGEQDSVRIKVRNIGIDTLTSIPVCFQIRLMDSVYGASIDTQICETITYPHGNYPNGLPPLGIDVIDFTGKFSIPRGLYQIWAYPSLSGDADATNDTTNSKGHFGFTSDTISHSQNFDAQKPKWATTLVEPGTCGNPPPDRPTIWERGTPNYNVTTGAYSAPNAWDINIDTGYSQNDFEVLYTNFFDMTKADSAFMSFWHNRNTTAGEDGYYIDYSFNRFSSFARLTSASQPVGRKINWIEDYLPLGGSLGRGWNGLTNAWEYSQIPLNNSPFRGKPEVQFRFVFRSILAATPLDGVSIDDFRIVNPDLYDAELFDVIEPNRGCVLGINEPYAVVVKNTGKDTIEDVLIHYQYRFDPTCTGTWGPWTSTKTDTITTPILPGVDVTFYHQDSVNMSVFGCYEFRQWVTHPDDNNQTNDTIFSHIVENVRGCEIDLKVTTGGTTPDGEIVFQDSTTLDTLWIYPFSAIGPNVIQWAADVCLNEKGSYLFKITSTDTTMIDFWRLRDPFGDSTVLIGFDPDSQYFHWECPPLLSASAEQIIIEGASALPIPQDYEVSVRSRNRGSVKLNYVWIRTEIRYHTPIQFRGNLVYSATDSFYYGVIGDPILFPRLNLHDSIWVAQPGRYDVCSWTFLPNGNADSATYDDTVCTEFVVLDTVSTLPYCNDFDSDSTNPWGSMSKTSFDVQSIFERGRPNQTHLSSARSAPRGWMTDTTTNYPILDSSAVYSPEFTLDTSNCYNIDFYHKWKTEHAFDGGTVEFSADSGKTWSTVGGPLDPVDTAYDQSTKNWFNTPYVTGLAGQPHPPGWTATSQSVWTHSFRDFKLPHQGQNPMKVVFRFRFGSDASVENEGWLIDDFCLTDNGVCIFYSCTDGIMNGQETGVDCGGPLCDPCETCSDGLLNQNEDDVDCGGVCPPCPSCVDNVQNGQETEIDCGGPECPACPSCFDGIRTQNWVGGQKVWEDGIDCGTAAGCDPCWLGVDELDPNKLFLGQAIPNPAIDETLIRYQLPDDGNVVIIITSTLGQEMQRFELDNQQRGIQMINVDVSAWSQGLYYYSLEFNGERLIDKFVVEK